MAVVLSRFLEHIDLEHFLDWLMSQVGAETLASASEARPELTVGVLKSVLETIPPKSVQPIYLELDRVEAFVGEDEQLVLRQRCAQRSELVELLDARPDDRSRALAILDAAPDVFELAERDLDVSQLIASTRYWAGFRLGTSEAPAWSKMIRAGLESALSMALAERYGSPRQVVVERGTRPRPSLPDLVQIAIWHEGDIDALAEFDTEGQVVTRTTRRALQAAMLFDPGVGTIEVAARGGRAVQEAFAQAFARVCWKACPDLRPLSKASLALQKLRFPQRLTVDKASGLRSANLVALTLVPAQPERLVIGLRIGRRNGLTSLWAMAKEIFGASNPLTEPAMEVVKAEIRFEFEPVGMEKRAKRRTVKLSAPNGSTCANATERQKRIIDDHLRRWGLCADERGGANLAA